MHLYVLYGGAKRCRITGQGTAITALWVGHNSTILAAEDHLAKLCSSSTWCTELRFDHLGDKGKSYQRQQEPQHLNTSVR